MNISGSTAVFRLNHHGTNDSANAFFLSVLQPRIPILSTDASSQPSPDVMRRIFSEKIYPGPRDIFMTNSDWAGRREIMTKLFGQTDAAWVREQITKIAARQGHVLLRVEPGGARYRVIVIDDSIHDGNVTSVHGSYESRGNRKGQATAANRFTRG